MHKMLVLAALMLLIPVTGGCKGSGLGTSISSDSLTPSLNFTGVPSQSEPDLDDDLNELQRHRLCCERPLSGRSCLQDASPGLANIA